MKSMLSMDVVEFSNVQCHIVLLGGNVVFTGLIFHNMVIAVSQKDWVPESFVVIREFHNGKLVFHSVFHVINCKTFLKKYLFFIYFGK